MGFLADLTLKLIYYKSDMSSVEIAETVALPFLGVVDHVLEFLKREEYIEVTQIAEQISETILKDFENESLWEKKIRKIARLLKKIVENDFPKRTIKLKIGDYKDIPTAPGAERR